MLSKLWAAIAAVIGFAAALLWGRHQKAKQREAEARARVAERLAETIQEQEERREKVAQMSDSELIDYLRRDRR